MALGIKFGNVDGWKHGEKDDEMDYCGSDRDFALSARVVLPQDDDSQDEDSAQEQAAPPQYGSYNSGRGCRFIPTQTLRSRAGCALIRLPDRPLVPKARRPQLRFILPGVNQSRVD